MTLTHRASGAAEYRGLRAELVVSIRENDPSLVFSETALAVPEGETATYTVALATVPTGDVTVRITGVSGDLSLDKTELAYTPGDWDDAQTITVEAAEDDDTSTDPAVTLAHEASGGGYDGVVGTVRATIREDDGDPRPPPPPPPGPGPSPPPSNRPPVATEEMTARILEVGDTLELDASEHFRDPDRRRMTFEAESADSAVATVEVDESAVAVRAADHGITTVTVTAVDDRRARATQSFEVTVGRLVSFASEEVAAAEGDTATLTVAISRPRDAATSLDYVVGPDDDPATADADADDHDGMAGTVIIAARATQATIAIAVRDDDDIEPPRETFAVTLKRSAEQARDFGLGVAAVRVRIDEGVCDRTPQVRDALRRTLPCAWVSDSDLAGVRTLDLSNAGLVALQPADFSGLDNLRALDMSGNSLASLPDGVFAGLGKLSEARSQDNPGSPFVLRVELARTDGPASAPSPARLATRVRQGAPFPLRAGLKAVGGALSSDASVVATGMAESAPVSVARTSAGATRVELASTPSVPDTRCGRFGRYLCYRGFATAIGAPLVLFKDPPEVRGSVPATDLAAENDSIRISLSELFVAVGRPSAALRGALQRSRTRRGGGARGRADRGLGRRRTRRHGDDHRDRHRRRRAVGRADVRGDAGVDAARVHARLAPGARRGDHRISANWAGSQRFEGRFRGQCSVQGNTRQVMATTNARTKLSIHWSKRIAPPCFTSTAAIFPSRVAAAAVISPRRVATADSISALVASWSTSSAPMASAIASACSAGTPASFRRRA